MTLNLTPFLTKIVYPSCVNSTPLVKRHAIEYLKMLVEERNKGGKSLGKLKGAEENPENKGKLSK